MKNQNPLHHNRQSYFLQPGEVFVSRKDMTISTVLGSCVAVCFWEERRKIGGMNHVMLPIFREGESPTTRFANVATFVLRDMMRDEGCGTRMLTARVFGGASSLSTSGGGSLSVGPRNIEVTLAVLEKLKIPITGKDLGGDTGRKIFFDLHSGKIRMQYIRNYDFVHEKEDILHSDE